MLSFEQQDELNRRFSLLRLLALSMSGGMILCVAVVSLALKSGAGRGQLLVDRAPESLRQLFYLLAVLAAAAAAAARGQLLSDQALSGPARGGIEPLMAAIQARLIILLALCELVGTLGLVLFVLSQRMGDLTAFAAAALLGFLWLWPRQELWEQRVASLLAKT